MCIISEASRSKEERKLQAHVRVLEMQLSRANTQHERNAQHYKQEILRQSQVIQKLHMYLATQHYDNSQQAQDGALDNRPPSVTRYDSEVAAENGDDSISITSAGQFERGDLSATKDIPTQNHAQETPANQNQTQDTLATQNLNNKDTTQTADHPDTALDTMKAHMQSTENEFESKLKYLASKAPQGDEYMQHMQKLQVSWYERLRIVYKSSARNLHTFVFCYLLFNLS